MHEQRDEFGRAAGPRQQAEQGGRNLATATAAIAGMKASKSSRASSMKCATLVVPKAVPAQPGTQHRTPHPAQPARQRLAYQVTGPGCCAVAAAGWEQGIQRTLCTRGLVAKPGEHATRQLATSRRSAKYSTCPPSRSRAPTFQVLHTACCRACSQCERSGAERNTASFGPASARHSTQHWGLSASAGSDPCSKRRCRGQLSLSQCEVSHAVCHRGARQVHTQQPPCRGGLSSARTAATCTGHPQRSVGAGQGASLPTISTTRAHAVAVAPQLQSAQAPHHRLTLRPPPAPQSYPATKARQ